ncbi:hypothetical protein QBC38DRAFT_543841 [Podospora fimiseda]|uniref:Genetic interactor of prohibitins 3, mitochondrial n=1 Tax=Podospora fimiseda TaxID=252190 RepID=A0AAN7GX99_9PEZI|nr:hypothetical protein QBC38DRAFT_543841 [Podospora fimiseda]
MHIPPSRAACSRWLGRAFSIERNVSTSASTSELPLYLCPAFRSLSVNGQRSSQHTPFRIQQIRRLHTQLNEVTEDEPQPQISRPKNIPLQCHGCGALAQTAVPGEAGYYNPNRKMIRQYLGESIFEGPRKRLEELKRRDEAILQSALGGLDIKALEEQGINLSRILPQTAPEGENPLVEKSPLCERCHELLHHCRGQSIYHPTVESIEDTIQDSPYKYNHVYHILDAADFPMSLIPGLHNALDIALRSQNRRARTSKFYHGRKIEMSFIITRSDLLAPTKDQVDRLMPYIQETLREALGRIGHRVRLGNVRLVSAKRHWWTSELKKEIFERGGAGWMVGKVNVGKSQLFQAVFPKGMVDPNRIAKSKPKPKSDISIDIFPSLVNQPVVSEDADLDPMVTGLTASHETDLLPPPQPETRYPAMPIISDLPGTTASPIRLPFGEGKGELIDLPGISRGDLESYVREEHRRSLLLKSRTFPEQQVLKPGQSLLLGGFIRITPRNIAPDHELIFLAYAFTPIEAHKSSTEKAIAVQTQSPDAPRVENIALPGVGRKIEHAGAFQLRYDVTKKRTGPITSKVAVGLKVDQLPYRVLGIDILIEGCGWVELTVQIRTRQLYEKREPTSHEDTSLPDPFHKLEVLDKLDLRPEPVNARKESDQDWDNDYFDNVSARTSDPEPNWPVVDVYSPEGKFIGYRKPMNAWILAKPKKDRSKRPRKSMKGVKKGGKRERRAREGGDQWGNSFSSTF